MSKQFVIDEKLQAIKQSIDALDPVNVVPAASLDANGKIKDASSSNAGLMTPAQLAKIDELRSRPHNGLYEGRNLKEIFGTFAAMNAALASGDWSGIQDGDYWPITVSGTFKDYAANANKTINALFKMEANINVYMGYGDSGQLADRKDHILWVGRDATPMTLQMRSENSTWYSEAIANPWLGSHLFQTLNASDGLRALVQATDIGQYIYTGPNGKGMRSLMETKAKGATATTGWGWQDRGILFLPTEQEVWGETIFADSQYHSKGSPLQWPVFRGSRRHISKGIGDGGSRCTWWCESSNTGYAASFCRVDANGGPDDGGAAGTNICVPLCFITVHPAA